MEDLLYEAESVRHFTGLEMGKLPDESTILNFRHLLECHSLGVNILEMINEHLAGQGFSMRKGTIVMRASLRRHRQQRTVRGGVILR